MKRDKCLLVAELSANHNGDKSLALKSILKAKEVGFFPNL